MPAPTDEPQTRGHKKKERTRRQLLDAAIDVIAEQGEAFTVQHVAERAGVSNGTFYNYFEDRDQLIDAVLPEVVGTFVTETTQTVQQDDAAVRFATISAFALQRAVAERDAVRAMLRLDEVQRAILDGSGVFDDLRADLADGASAGRFTFDNERAALDVVVGSLLLAARRLADGSAPPSYPANVVSTLLRSLGVPSEEASEIATRAVDLAVQAD